MKFLLDTHIVLWFANEPEKLSSTALNLITNTLHDKFISIVSVWEIAIKSNVGKLKLNAPVKRYVQNQIEVNGFEELALSIDHLAIYETLPLANHRDPFDRLLVAQVMSEGLTLVSVDSAFDQYDIQRIWQ